MESAQYNSQESVIISTFRLKVLGILRNILRYKRYFLVFTRGVYSGDGDERSDEYGGDGDEYIGEYSGDGDECNDDGDENGGDGD